MFINTKHSLIVDKGMEERRKKIKELMMKWGVIDGEEAAGAIGFVSGLIEMGTDKGSSEQVLKDLQEAERDLIRFGL